MPEFGNTVRIYFLSGATESMQAPALALSEGWHPIGWRHAPEYISDAVNKFREAAATELESVGFRMTPGYAAKLVRVLPFNV